MLSPKGMKNSRPAYNTIDNSISCYNPFATRDSCCATYNTLSNRKCLLIYIYILYLIILFAISYSRGEIDFVFFFSMGFGFSTGFFWTITSCLAYDKLTAVVLPAPPQLLSTQGTVTDYDELQVKATHYANYTVKFQVQDSDLTSYTVECHLTRQEPLERKQHIPIKYRRPPSSQTTAGRKRKVHFMVDIPQSIAYQVYLVFFFLLFYWFPFNGNIRAVTGFKFLGNDFLNVAVCAFLASVVSLCLIAVDAWMNRLLPLEGELGDPVPDEPKVVQQGEPVVFPPSEIPDCICV
jgi:uncharacterized integral membrane protein